MVRYVVFWLIISFFGCGYSWNAGQNKSIEPTNETVFVGEFHLSVFNACEAMVQLRLGRRAENGKVIVILKQMRDTIKGSGGQKLWLLDRQEQPIASYQPVEGKQKVQVTADCTGLIREY